MSLGRKAMAPVIAACNPCVGFGMELRCWGPGSGHNMFLCCAPLVRLPHRSFGPVWSAQPIVRSQPIAEGAMACCSSLHPSSCHLCVVVSLEAAAALPDQRLAVPSFASVGTRTPVWFWGARPWLVLFDWPSCALGKGVPCAPPHAFPRAFGDLVLFGRHLCVGPSLTLGLGSAELHSVSADEHSATTCRQWVPVRLPWQVRRLGMWLWQDYVVPALLSLLALHLLVLFRLLFAAVPLRPRAPCTNSAIRTVRRSVRGAPLLLVFVWLHPVAVAMPSSQTPDMQVPLQEVLDIIHSPVNRPPPAAGASRSSCSWAGSTADAPTTTADDGAPVCPTVVVASPSTPSAEDVAGVAPLTPPEPAHWLFPVICLRYQQPHLFAEARSDVDLGVERLFGIAEACLRDDMPECHVTVVHPQPHIGAPTFLVVVPCAQDLGRIPVCLQVYQPGTRPLISMEYLDETCFLQDLRELLPLGYREDVHFYIGDRHAPFEEFDTLRACPGLLIRVFPVSVENPRRPLPLELRLQHAWDEFADIEVDGPPTPDYSHFTLCILAPAEFPRMFATLEGILPECELAVAYHMHRPQASFRLIAPTAGGAEVSIQGVPASRIFGLLPPDTAQLISIFVDPRALAQHIRVVLLPPVPLTASDLLRYSDVHLSGDYVPLIEGFGDDQPFLPRMQFRSGEVVKISALARRSGACPEPDLSTGCGVFVQDASHHSGCQRSVGGQRDRSRSCRGAAASSGDEASLASPGTDGRRGHPAYAELVVMWNRGTCVDSAHSWRSPEDTSATGVPPMACHPQHAILLALAGNILLREDCRLHNCLFIDPASHVVSNSLEPGDPQLPAHALFPDLQATGHEGDSSDEPAQWRITVCVLRYQSAPKFRALWVIEGDSVADFVRRARFVLRPAGTLDDAYLVPLPACPHAYLCACPPCMGGTRQDSLPRDVALDRCTAFC